ncbi:succinyl-diaminopimelate desuccinylase [Buchnera aphidicola str. APS (Acyrthosiphon pisum)]|uniref:Succinyl-diaminopimelate desuccinylase n=1 Tax=Buchnera aphidicola subsp. Acyrthosiphon pisum (strain APS) TaxID=107806 RepID=DAPE_BUCAI|nr:succinyl-diaminopimelate desuccinylase [Buchnera aphidicola]P57196.1 RecName: Full=Succinyl-diaminopimelate desuccinylase; Short=SDAP desuccinylase; AltName: Full=N-succinyl-LL-2,6-diaminoheptanedioate amidohydrolase [Buchnera aphidicola str. APS (Acyrthosiphon pisum)]pir/F84940/ succinyl-diaminopimelate desuccinylase (EC 3.5.1.18) [imported] - Buchnera sp. (strain APS) [Buchnera sp. (in: enterobacteria)]BAB12814.1 succinyl-diaminopimelate desuccinylase [Buchnera aphidicola str. APS (Acyrthos
MTCSITELAKKLISIPSVSPKDLGCQDIIIKRLCAIGFDIKRVNVNDTKNFWAFRGTGKTLTFAGHTDVVPIGQDKDWQTDPFQPVIRSGYLFGRGSADMKGALAAMITAAERFVNKFPNHKGRLSFLITSDEESSAVDGTIKIVEYLMSKRDMIDYCIVGEPSSTNIVGDVIKNGRRGSITANITIYGIQGHIAYPDLADNPIHKGLPVILKILSIKLDSGNDFFLPSSINIANIHAGNGFNNVIPGSLFVQFNIRFSSEVSEKHIQSQIVNILNSNDINYSIEWLFSGKPFITKKGLLIDTVIQSIFYFNKKKPILSTSGGTSDGRFIALMGSEVVELGLVNNTIHKVNECVKISDLKLLSCMYEDIMKNLLS